MAAFKRRALGEAGQSTVEFALTMILLMAFVLFFIQLALVSAFGNYVHYATFMSARAYLSAGSDTEEQRTRAKDVITRMLKQSAGDSSDRFRFIGNGTGSSDMGVSGLSLESAGAAPERASSWMNGVRYTFRSRIFLLPLGSGSASASANTLTLTSESWLGREPTYQECADFLGRKDIHGIFDNGC